MQKPSDERLELISKLRDFARKLEELPQEINKLVDENFWELLNDEASTSVKCEHEWILICDDRFKVIRYDCRWCPESKPIDTPAEQLDSKDKCEHEWHKVFDHTNCTAVIRYDCHKCWESKPTKQCEHHCEDCGTWLPKNWGNKCLGCTNKLDSKDSSENARSPQGNKDYCMGWWAGIEAYKNSQNARCERTKDFVDGWNKIVEDSAKEAWQKGYRAYSDSLNADKQPACCETLVRLDSKELTKLVLSQTPLDSGIGLHGGLGIQDLEARRVKRAELLSNLICSKFATQPHSCTCKRHPDSAFTVRIVNGLSICPRCGGVCVPAQKREISEERIRILISKSHGYGGFVSISETAKEIKREIEQGEK